MLSMVYKLTCNSGVLVHWCAFTEYTLVIPFFFPFSIFLEALFGFIYSIFTFCEFSFIY